MKCKEIETRILFMQMSMIYIKSVRSPTALILENTIVVLMFKKCCLLCLLTFALYTRVLGER